MLVARSRKELRDTLQTWRDRDIRTALVPTMGALHEGHASLIRLATTRADKTLATIFVNPTQFAPHEDLARYPRQEESDLQTLEKAGCDLVWLPTDTDLYPPGEQTRVVLPALGAKLEGRARPHFFGGVATIVSRLFVQIRPDIAVFGEKDFQQLQIIRRMVRDFGFEIEIIAGATGRAADGLALSSRNAYLSAAERRIAPVIFQTLNRLAKRIRAGSNLQDALQEAHSILLNAGIDRVDYLEACDNDTLDPLSGYSGRDKARLLVAVWLGRTRLIDNIPV